MLTAIVFVVWINITENIRPASHIPYRRVKHHYENSVKSNSVKTNEKLTILRLSASTSGKNMKNSSIGGKCKIMHNQIHLYNTSDVVIFKQGALAEAFFNYRPPGQRWVFMGREAAYRAPGNKETNKLYKNRFNYTMTYSIHADFYLPYGKCEEIESNPAMVSKQIDDIVKNKTDLVSWLVGHCGTSSMRENYARELMRHIPVDLYGDCGNNSICPRNTKIICNVEKYLQKYKFYLAFENTLSGEYISEKLWRTLSIGLVPIVYGALETYSTVLPSGSYIDVEDFSSPQELAKYIFKVNSNDALYRSFFSWKYKYKCTEAPTKEYLPALCDFLISSGNKMSIKSNVWEYPATRTEDARLYLKRLGVSDVTKHGIRLK